MVFNTASTTAKVTVDCEGVIWLFGTPGTLTQVFTKPGKFYCNPQFKAKQSR